MTFLTKRVDGERKKTSNAKLVRENDNIQYITSECGLMKCSVSVFQFTPIEPSFRILSEGTGFPSDKLNILI